MNNITTLCCHYTRDGHTCTCSSCPERLGIIGELMSKLDSSTLRYKEAMQSDSEAEEEDTQSCLSDVSGIIEDDGEGEDTF